MLRFAEHKAQKLKLEQLCLNARKGTFIIDWYRRHGYEIYDENCEYSNGQTVGMYKNLDQIAWNPTLKIDELWLQDFTKYGVISATK